MKREDCASLRVLLVTEGGFAAHTLRSVLTLAGVTGVETIPDPSGALEIFSMERYDSVFCNEECPAVEGLAFPLAVRQRSGIVDPMVPIFVFHERARRCSVDAARDQGATDYLTCPVSPKTVMTKLEAAIASPKPYIKSSQLHRPRPPRQYSPGMEW